MLKRTAKVDSLHLDSAGISSVIQIGDSVLINCFTRAVAVQREKELFYSNEGDFKNFEIFSRSIPLTSIDEPIRIRSTAMNPFIKVGEIDVIGISASSVLHIGNTQHVYSEARIKHIRQLQPRDDT